MEPAPVITVGSLSKALWGGLRVGWLRAPQPWLERLARRKVATDLGSGVLDQAVATRLLANLPELEDANSRLLRDRLAATEHLLAAHLPDWTWDRPAGGPALWVKLPYDAGPFCQLALRHGVEVVPGATFGTEGTFADHVRIPFTADPTVMAEAIQRLAAADADLLDGRRCAEGSAAPASSSDRPRPPPPARPARPACPPRGPAPAPAPAATPGPGPPRRRRVSGTSSGPD